MMAYNDLSECTMDFEGCDHGIGFDEHCEDCEDDPIGCVFPGRCLMPGVHLESECHTVEMMEQMVKDGEA